MPNDLAPPLFMGMLLTMMAAMMLPTVIPMVLAHRMVVLARGEGLLPTGVRVIAELGLEGVEKAALGLALYICGQALREHAGQWASPPCVVRGL